MVTPRQRRFDMSRYIDLLAIGTLGAFGQVEWSLKRVFYVD
jgi:RNA polymerase sigma-70 factor, ECF subfamily